MLDGSTRAFLGAAGVTAVAVAAEAALRSGAVDIPGLPLPSGVARGVIDLLPEPVFWASVAFTLGQWMLGLLLATAGGVLVGSLMGASRRACAALQWPVEALRVLPSVAVGPLLVLVVGGEVLPLSLTVALSCAWPVLLTTMYGVRDADATAVLTARSFGASNWEVLRQVRIPSALPFTATGVRTAASVGLLVAVSAELLIGDGSGIGGFILARTANATDLGLVYAAALVAALLGLLVDAALAGIDGALFSWRATP